MADNERIEEEIGVGIGAPEAPAIGAGAREGEAPPAGTIMTHTVDEMPELEGLSVGDQVAMIIRGVNEDGTYELEVQPVEIPEELPAEGEVVEEEGLTEALL
jgi:hypothetical protein